jgi:putative membrane protein
MASTVSSTDLPAATKLAFDRTRLAYERTMMAWVRTATSLISFGFTIYKFFQYLRQDRHVEGGGLGPRSFAMMMIGIGLTALVLATVEHRKHIDALRAEYGAAANSLAAVVAVLVSILGVLGLVTVVLRQ